MLWEKIGEAGTDTLLRYEVFQGMDADRNASGVFIVARLRHEE